MIHVSLCIRMQEGVQRKTSAERLATAASPVRTGIDNLESATHQGVFVVHCDTSKLRTVLVMNHYRNTAYVETLEIFAFRMLSYLHVIHETRTATGLCTNYEDVRGFVAIHRTFNSVFGSISEIDINADGLGMSNHRKRKSLTTKNAHGDL